MLLKCRREDEDVIKKGEHAFANEDGKRTMHCFVESTWSACESEWNDNELVVATFGPKSRLGNVSFKNANLMVAALEIYLREIFCSISLSKIYLMRGMEGSCTTVQSIVRLSRQVPLEQV